MTAIQSIPLHVPFRIVSVEGDSALALRVQELGLIPGALCSIVRRAPFGGPMQIQLERRHLGLRLDDEVRIYVERAAAA